MMRAPLWLGAALLAQVFPATADEPATWLAQASAAARDASYQGIVVYRDARMMEVMRVIHRSKDGQVQERLTSLTGRPRDILQEGDRVAWLAAGGPLEAAGGVPRGLLPVMPPEDLGGAAEHYEFRDLGDARVAGRACRGVVMIPRDEFRYGYEICADRVTAVPLRVTLLDRAGKAVEQLMFTEVSFPESIADAAFVLPPGAVSADLDAPVVPAAVPAVRAAPDAGAPAWQLARLPPGFRVVLRERRTAADGLVTEHVLVSDGVSAVSVFGVPPGAAKLFSGLSHMGAMNAYGRRVGRLHITVVGEVPQSTVRMIGDGLEAGDETEPPTP